MNKKFLVIILCLATFVLGYGASKYKCLGALSETKEDHINKLAYTMPEPGFYHKKVARKPTCFSSGRNSHSRINLS